MQSATQSVSGRSHDAVIRVYDEAGKRDSGRHKLRLLASPPFSAGNDNGDTAHPENQPRHS